MKVAWADEGSQMDVDAGGVETSGPGTDAGAVETFGAGTDAHSDDDDFGGASSAAQSGLGDGYQCDKCGRTRQIQSAHAYFTEKNKFATCPNAEVHRSIQQVRKDNGEGYQNFPHLGMNVRQICAVCGEDLHGQQGKYVDWKQTLLGVESRCRSRRTTG